MENRYILAESKHYEVSHEYEVVFLTHKTPLFADAAPEIIIGDFYGDPAAAIIDEKERFVVMAGCGLIIYKLAEPFESYRYQGQTSQWTEMFREPPNCWWIESLTQHADNIIRFIVNADSEAAGTYQLTFPDMEIQRLQ